MALTQVNSGGIEDGSIVNADLKSDAAIAKSKLANLDIVNADINTSADIAGSKLDDNAVTASKMAATLDLSSHTVTLPAASVQAHANDFDDNLIQANIAMLGFKVAAANDLAKFNLVDQIIDEYEDASGIDASASTNEALSGGAYSGTGTQSTTPTVTGGTITTDGDYKVHTFTSDGNYVTDTTQNIDVLVVAGGGPGGRHGGGGGGAGGLIYATTWQLASGTHAVTVGDGGTAEHSGNPGDDSSIGSLLVAKGGGKGRREGGTASDATPYAGGSGGGVPRTSPAMSGTQPSQSGDSGTYGFGNNGGTGSYDNGDWAAGGGGGAGQVGENGNGVYPGNGGNGKSVSITGSAVTYAGGGGGASHTGGTHNNGTGGSGGGGTAGNAQFDNGDDATGYGSGGGGGAKDSSLGGAGSDGIVIFRRKTTFDATVYQDLTLQSVATTAEAAPTKADLIILIENAAGTATINTDVKGYISRDGSAFSSAVTFVDEGTWGTNKKVLAAHDVDISGITSGTSMKYKITTHNQGAAKITKIHAASLGWR